ncbi:hypothetical protein FA13DRAFT_1714252 [Coprinellus micaceus]|uniref:Uncharacterized protein n=1 Tax=Coprinellus micaceus TaxID=71717 RepID=A0A4Y7SSV4_COPMI|nr:hypothetical protein FA13DRAFT_1714252 [Coprinellus micaceus]
MVSDCLNVTVATRPLHDREHNEVWHRSGWRTMNRDYTAIANRTLVTSGARGYHGGTRGTAQNVALLGDQKFEADALRVWHLCHPYWRTMNQDRTTMAIEILATRGAGSYYSSTGGAVQNAPLSDKSDTLHGSEDDARGKSPRRN